MAIFLKQSTSVDLPIGPFVDSTDGVTAETALTITQPDVRLKKNGGAWAQKAAAQTLAHEENGYYEVTLDATDTDTLGVLTLAVNEAGALPVFMSFHVVTANVWDTLFGADKLEVDVVQWLGTAAATPTVAGVPEVDVTHWRGTAAPAEHTSGYPIVTVKDGTGTGEINTNAGKIVEVEGLTGHSAQTGDSFARLGAPAGASVSADIAAIEAQTDDIGVAGAGLTAITSKTDNLPSDPADASVVAGLIAAVETKVDTVDTVVDAVQAKTDNLPSDPADQSLIIAATDAVMTRLGTPAGASVSADIATLPSDATILVAIMATPIESGMSFKEWARGVSAKLFGRVEGAGTGQEDFYAAVSDYENAPLRIREVNDASGNRTDVDVNLGD